MLSAGIHHQCWPPPASSKQASGGPCSCVMSGPSQGARKRLIQRGLGLLNERVTRGSVSCSARCAPCPPPPLGVSFGLVRSPRSGLMCFPVAVCPPRVVMCCAPWHVTQMGLGTRMWWMTSSSSRCNGIHGWQECRTLLGPWEAIAG
jgi:hypothetical protein